MEIILLALIAVTAANTAVTVYFGKQLLRREEYRIEFVPIPSDYLKEQHAETQAEPEQQKEILQPEPVAVSKPSATNDAYSAWTNRKGIPISDLYRSPEPPIKAKENGPLSRPDGFV